MAQSNAHKWTPRINKKYDSPGFVKGRQAPFTLAEIRGREQDKVIEKVKLMAKNQRSAVGNVAIKIGQERSTETLEISDHSFKQRSDGQS